MPGGAVSPRWVGHVATLCEVLCPAWEGAPGLWVLRTSWPQVVLQERHPAGGQCVAADKPCAKGQALTLASGLFPASNPNSLLRSFDVALRTGDRRQRCPPSMPDQGAHWTIQSGENLESGLSSSFEGLIVFLELS